MAGTLESRPAAYPPAWPTSRIVTASPLRGVSRGARQFTAANSEHFVAASYGGANFSTADFSISVAFYRDSSGAQIIASKYQNATNYWEIGMNASNRPYFQSVVAGVQKLQVITPAAFTITDQAWHTMCVVFDRDTAANCLVYVDGSDETEAVSTVTSTDSVDNTGSLYIGQEGASAEDWNGRIARLQLFGGDLLTAAEATWLHNSGKARLHHEIGVTGTGGANLSPTGSYNLNENSGDAIAQTGNNGTDTNTVTSAVGPQ